MLQNSTRLGTWSSWFGQVVTWNSKISSVHFRLRREQKWFQEVGRNRWSLLHSWFWIVWTSTGDWVDTWWQEHPSLLRKQRIVRKTFHRVRIQETVRTPVSFFQARFSAYGWHWCSKDFAFTRWPRVVDLWITDFRLFGTERSLYLRKWLHPWKPISYLVLGNRSRWMEWRVAQEIIEFFHWKRSRTCERTQSDEIFHRERWDRRWHEITELTHLFQLISLALILE